MSKKISQMPAKASMVEADEFTIVDSQDANDSTKNKRVQKSVALASVQPVAPTDGANKLGIDGGWTNAGDSATRNVGTGSGDVAAGNAPDNAVSAHDSNASAHSGNIPSTTQKAALDGNVSLSGANPVADVDSVPTEASDIGAEPAFSKNTGFNKNFGTISGTVAEGDHLHDGTYEPDLGNPAQDGQVLSSTTTGIRSWVDNVGSGTDEDAIHDNVANEIALITEKTTPASADILIIEDSAAANSKKKVQIGNLPTGGGGEANTGSNQGTDGVGVYDAKVGIDLQFRNIAPASNKVTVVLNGKDVDIDIAEAQINHNNLAGYVANEHLDWTQDQGATNIDSGNLGADIARLNATQEWTRTQNFDATTLVDSASIAWDASQNQVCSVILAGNRTLSNPTNLQDGGTYILIVKQDAIGGRTLSYGSAYKWPGGTAPTLTTSANAVDILSFVSDGTNMYGVESLDFS